MKARSTRVTNWSTLPTAALHGKILDMQLAGEKFIDLSIGISNLSVPKQAKQAAMRAIRNDEILYTAIGGSSPLKEIICEKVRRENKISAKPDNVIVTAGAKQAIYEALFTVTNPKDSIAFFTPYWSAYTQISSMLDLNDIFYTLDETIDLPEKSVPKALKAIVVDNPHNPLGHLFSKDELLAVIDFAKKHDLYIIADEGYENLVYDGEHIAIASLTDYEKIISIFSASQSFAMMGWRVGYAIAPVDVIKEMEALQSAITAAPSDVTQIALAECLAMDTTYREKMKTTYKKRRDVMSRELDKIPWLKHTKPDGGAYFFCNITGLTPNSLEFCEKLLEKRKVAVMPGDAFGAPGWIRIGFNVQNASDLVSAAKKIAEFGTAYAKPTSR